MNTTDPQQPELPEVPENESSFLPKLEDMAALTGLFTPSAIFEELEQLELLDEAKESAEQGETKD